MVERVYRWIGPLLAFFGVGQSMVLEETTTAAPAKPEISRRDVDVPQLATDGPDPADPALAPPAPIGPVPPFLNTSHLDNVPETRWPQSTIFEVQGTPRVLQDEVEARTTH